MRILLVEDNVDHRELMSLTLAGHDPAWQVEEAASGRDALRRLAEEEAYDLVFLDYSLPGRDGLEVLGEIQQGVLTPLRLQSKVGAAPPPVVMVTGLGDEQVAVEAMKAGAYDYVVKRQGYLRRLPVVARRAVEAHQLAVERVRTEKELQHTLDKLRRTLGATIQVMASTVEARDPYTAGHQRRVADLACAIATEMGLSKDQTEGIRMAAVIHDIGKITVPAEILSKPGRLNDLEFNLIKMHPQAGYDILKRVEFPWPIAQIVFQHHERLDGSGYPQGLSGGDILLEAKILAVADVVEAMASHRPYRPARGIDQALEEISQNRGVLYDPEVVDACLKVFTEKGFEFE
jgi:putative two-component system response regulator